MPLHPTPPIRHAQESDLPRIIDIYNASIPGRMATADTEPVTLASRLPWWQAHNPQQWPIWVYEQNTLIMAWISASAFYGRPAYRSTAEFSLYVAPPYQKQGIGTQLLQHLIQNSPHLGITTVLGFIFAHNHPSLKLSQKLGFQQWGHLPEVATLDGQLYDLIIMGRKITPTKSIPPNTSQFDKQTKQIG